MLLTGPIRGPVFFLNTLQSILGASLLRSRLPHYRHLTEAPERPFPNAHSPRRQRVAGTAVIAQAANDQVIDVNDLTETARVVDAVCEVVQGHIGDRFVLLLSTSACRATSCR